MSLLQWQYCHLRQFHEKKLTSREKHSVDNFLRLLYWAVD